MTSSPHSAATYPTRDGQGELACTADYPDDVKNRWLRLTTTVLCVDDDMLHYTDVSHHITLSLYHTSVLAARLHTAIICQQLAA